MLLILVAGQHALGWWFKRSVNKNSVIKTHYSAKQSMFGACKTAAAAKTDMIWSSNTEVSFGRWGKLLMIRSCNDTYLIIFKTNSKRDVRCTCMYVQHIWNKKMDAGITGIILQCIVYELYSFTCGNNVCTSVFRTCTTNCATNVQCLMISKMAALFTIGLLPSNRLAGGCLSIRWLPVSSPSQSAGWRRRWRSGSAPPANSHRSVIAQSSLSHRTFRQVAT